MRLIEFCPGEGSRFLVGTAHLNPLDAMNIGGSGDTYLISFGSELPGDMSTYWFEATPTVRPILSREYFEQKMPRLDAASRIVGLWVVADLLGREAIDAKYSPEQLGWSEDWRDQLTPLRTIVLGDGRGLAAP